MASIAEPEAAIAVRGRGPVRIGPIALTLPSLFGMLFFFAAPLVAFAIYSFLTAGLYRVSGPLTLDGYREAVSSDVNGTLAVNSFVVGICAAAVTVAVGLAIAYWLRYAAGRWQVFVLFLITATLFASYLVRLYAWRTILGENGLLNSGLEGLGLIDEPLGFLLYNRFAVTVALVHIFLPYVVLVLFAGFRPISPALLETAQDLGAGAAHPLAQSRVTADRSARRDVVPLRLHPFGRRLRDAAIPWRQGRRDARGADTGRPHRCR